MHTQHYCHVQLLFTPVIPKTYGCAHFFSTFMCVVEMFKANEENVRFIVLDYVIHR